MATIERLLYDESDSAFHLNLWSGIHLVQLKNTALIEVRFYRHSHYERYILECNQLKPDPDAIFFAMDNSNQ